MDDASDSAGEIDIATGDISAPVAESGGEVQDTRGPEPAGAPMRMNTQGGAVPDAISSQLSIFPGGEAGPLGRAVPRLPFEPEPAPTAWQEWLDRVEVVVVEDPRTWEDAVAAARAAGVCGFDTETTGLDPFVNEIRLVQLAVPVYPAGKKNLVAEDGLGPEPGSGAVAYVADLWRFGPGDRRRILESVAALAADPGVSFAGCNLKFDLKFLRAELAAAEGKPRWPGKRFPCERLFDVMLASQLAVAGDFVPEAQFPKWCGENGIHVVKEGNGPTRYFDRHGHEIHFERDTQKKIRPVYMTHSLYEVAHRHLEVALDKTEQAGDWSREELTPEQVRYAGLDAAVLLPLREILEKLLRKNRLARAAKIEFDVLPATAEVEACGMPFDTRAAWELETRVREAVGAARAGLVEAAREVGFRARPKKSEGKRYSPDLNPDSAVDVVDCLELLAAREGVLVEKKGGGKGFRLPDGEVLPLASRDEVVSRVAVALPDDSPLRRFILLLQEYRKQKKKSDFLKKWIELTHPVTGRLHPDLRQLNPQAVGRYSASNPNVQQAGRDKELRALFRVDGGRTLILADYSSIEMRVACEISGDRELMRAFNEGVDVHKFTASYVSGKPLEEVGKEDRQFAKSLNFGLIYGMSPKTLKEYAELGYGVRMSLREAEEAREKFFRLYSGVAAWHERERHAVYESRFGEFHRHDGVRGYYTERRPLVRMPGGHVRVWPVVEENGNGGGTYLRKAGPLTEVYNSPVQGGAAELLKVAMARLYRELLARGWDDVYMTMTLHDELHLEAPANRAEEAAEVLRSAMVGARDDLGFAVPVEVECCTGQSWAEKE